jgi:hypothetical protein
LDKIIGSVEISKGRGEEETRGCIWRKVSGGEEKFTPVYSVNLLGPASMTTMMMTVVAVVMLLLLIMMVMMVCFKCHTFC